MRRYIRQNHSSRIPPSMILAAIQTDTQANDKTDTQLHTYKRIAAAHYKLRQGEYHVDTAIDAVNDSVFWQWVMNCCTPHRAVFMVCNDAGQLLTLSRFWQRVDDCEFNQRWCRVCGEPAYADICCGKKVWRGTHVTSDPPVIVSVRNSYGILRIVSISNYFNRLRKLDVNAHTQLTELAGELLPRMHEWSQLQLGCWQTTAAGLSWTSWRHTLRKKEIVHDDSPDQLAIAREAYYAGQCESYYIGSVNEPVYKVDAKAFYPSIMAAEVFPVSYSHTERNISISRLIDTSDVLLPIARVRIHSNVQTYPVHHNGRLLFVNGDFVTTLAAPELMYAINQLHISEVHQVCWYHAGRPFDRWVNFWLHQRREAEYLGDKQKAAFCKLVANSLSGKLAAWSVKWKDVEYPNPPARWCEWHQVKLARDTDGKLQRIGSDLMRARAGWVQTLLPPCEGRDSIPSMAAFITSYGRQRMRYIKSICPSRSVLYQDTDAVIVTEPGLYAIQQHGKILGDGYGDFRVEQYAERCYIHAQKFYEMDDSLTAAGIKKEHERTGTRSFEQVNMQKLNGILSTEPREVTHSRKVSIVLTARTSHRIKLDDGWTEPHRLMHK